MPFHNLNEGKHLKGIARTQQRKFLKSLKKFYDNSNKTKTNNKLEDLHGHFNKSYGDTLYDENDDDKIDDSITTLKMMN